MRKIMLAALGASLMARRQCRWPQPQNIATEGGLLERRHVRNSAAPMTPGHPRLSRNFYYIIP